MMCCVLFPQGSFEIVRRFRSELQAAIQAGSVDLVLANEVSLHCSTWVAWAGTLNVQSVVITQGAHTSSNAQVL